jgi:hypothetical protein
MLKAGLSGGLRPPSGRHHPVGHPAGCGNSASGRRREAYLLRLDFLSSDILELIIRLWHIEVLSS